MGVFDPENSLSIESTPEVEPSTNGEDTSAEDGHVVEEKETQAPEATNETEVQEGAKEVKSEETQESEESEESEVTQEDEENKQQEKDEQKLYADKFKTVGWLFNGINDAADKLGETIDLNRINSIEDAEAYYKELQQRIGRGEIKNLSRSERKTKTEETEPEIKFQPSEYEKQMAKVIEDSKATLKQLETEVDTEDDEEFEIKFNDNPRKALADRDAKIAAKLEKKFEAMMNLKGAELGQTLAPILEGYRYWQDQSVGEGAWNQALTNMDNALKEHSINDFEKDLPAVLEYIKSDPQLIDLVNASPRDVKVRETVIRIAYRDLKSKAKESTLSKKLEEFAKTTADKDTKKINDSKAGLKIQSGVGGGANNAPRKENELDKIFGKTPESTGVFG